MLLSWEPISKLLSEVNSQFIRCLLFLVNPENITRYDSVDKCLNTATYDGYDIIKVLVIVAIDPVEDVESAIQGGGYDVRDHVGLGLPGLDDHHELGDQGDGLKVDGEGPHDLHEAGLVIDVNSQDQAWDDKKLDAERVVLLVKTFLKK